MRNHPLIVTLKKLRGNARGCVYTEPLWGIPFNLYAPYASVYMLAFGLTDGQIGLITTLGTLCQIFWMALSGAITDKLGRRRTTLIFDLISWSIPCLIWAFARDFTSFLLAAVVNSVLRVTQNSWQLLLVEDIDPDLLVDVYSWVYIAGLLAAFVSPLTGPLIGRFDLIPTMRGLYLLSFVMMTIKFILTNAMTTETRQGLIRMQETQSQPLFAVLCEYPDVLRQILRSPATLFTAGLLIILNIGNTIRGTFWSILVTEKLRIPAHHLALYPFARSVTMLLFFFLFMPRLARMDVRRPMIVGFWGLILSQLLLILVPIKSYGWLMLSTIIEAASVPVASTLLDKLFIVTIDEQERARITAILYVVILALTSPFGWIAGQLSEIDRCLPFVLNIVLLGLGIVLLYLAIRATQGRSQEFAA